ncbi:uncharacterized protein LOC143378248, partial [Andrena cerasifolii]|uniref:uncharacterized protein LOC143378248 n=1 Tax=Andrena cerasifolii TaxID=2819439 RepID=UPI0040377CD9
MSDAGSADNTIVDLGEKDGGNARLARVDAMKLPELKQELQSRKLKISGKKKELQDRLRAALTLEAEHGEDADEDEDGSDESEDDDVKKCTRQTQMLTFKDVEESMGTFSGDDKVNVRCWLEEFEDMAELCKWSDIQKIVYAKRLLRGSAKLYVNYEKCCRKWSEMKQALRSEFARVVDVHKIHKELSRRTKKTNESYQEYIYQMLEIAKQADMEVTATIKYIIEGIQDDECNKMILYGAKSVRELKEKFESYEAMKENARVKSRRTEEKTKKAVREGVGAVMQGGVRKCFLCGDRNHLSATCPTKSKGMKCFKCQGYGHIALECKGESKPVKDVSSTSEASRKKRLKEVQIENCELVALIDSGSDLNLIRADHYVKIGAPRLSNTILQFRGVAVESHHTLGVFSTHITIDHVVYPIDIHVVPDVLTSHGLIIGTDFLDSVKLIMKGGEISIRKLDVPEVYSISVEPAVNGVDLSHVTVPEHREAIEVLVENYKPNKTREVGVTMNIILTDDVPVYQRPRRLSPKEKAIVDEQIKAWVENGIIRPSHSDYGSPIVLVVKKDGTIRICIDFRHLNKKIVKDRYPLPLIEDELDSLQGAKVFSTLDLKNGFFHVPIEEGSQKYTAFVVPNGHYEFLRVPFGLCNSPAVFQRFIHAVFRELIAVGMVRVYMDDIIVLANDVVSAIANLEAVLGVASQFGLVVNWGAETELHTDASGLGYGAILLQRDTQDGAFHPVYYASGKTTPAEEKYPSYELEVLAIIKSLKKFRAFTLTMNKKDLCVRVARWVLLLQEFQYTIEHRPGRSMVHVDALSRNPLPTIMLVEEDDDGIIVRLREAQRGDDELRKICDNIEQYRKNGYVVSRDVLYRVVNDTPLVVVPKPMQ